MKTSGGNWFRQAATRRLLVRSGAGAARAERIKDLASIQGYATISSSATASSLASTRLATRRPRRRFTTQAIANMLAQMG